MALEKDREGFLKRMLAEAFTALSANPAKYRISEESSGDEYAKTNSLVLYSACKKRKGSSARNWE